MEQTHHYAAEVNDLSSPSSISAEELRLRALNDAHVLDLGADYRFDRITRLCRDLFKVPLAYISFIDRELARVKASSGDLPETPGLRKHSFSNMAIQKSGLFLIEDASVDARYATNPNVTGEAHVRFFAAYPIEFQGQRVGALCLMSTEARHFSDFEASLLRDLARWIQYEVQRDSDQARTTAVHRALLPVVPPSLEGFELVGRCIPARVVGGDFYDWHLSGDDELVLTLADVMGKGMGAAMVMATVRTVLKLTPRTADLADSVLNAERILATDLARARTFVTLFDARLTITTGDVEYVDAGLGLALVLHDNGTYERLPVRGLPMGLGTGTRWTSGHAHLELGDSLIVFSDGIYDALGGGDEAFDTVASHLANADSLEVGVGSLITSFADRPAGDDVTILAVRSTGPA